MYRICVIITTKTQLECVLRDVSYAKLLGLLLVQIWYELVYNTDNDNSN